MNLSRSSTKVSLQSKTVEIVIIVNFNVDPKMIFAGCEKNI